MGPRHHLGLGEVRLVEAEILEDGHGQVSVVPCIRGRSHQLVLGVAPLQMRSSRAGAARILQLQILQGGAAVLLARLGHHCGAVEHRDVVVLPAQVLYVMNEFEYIEKEEVEAEGMRDLVRHGAYHNLVVG
uniref:Uncharacterized protein n=1 Tax=Leishmania guyanensis TaxID=5670 RepID=A0A1E1J9H5_LEIGU|nr:Hypothetical protein BN36_NA77810 [Leishmania guyanensis]